MGPTVAKTWLVADRTNQSSHTPESRPSSNETAEVIVALHAFSLKQVFLAFSPMIIATAKPQSAVD
jgi:hypothetical protein